ncbi:MAG: hypothetical protein K2L11_09835 [Muribaculaceae bacterium]|nr:hypothetical protein [Muribaculaceae bacterium]
MKNNLDIDKLQVLLNKFYEAETTPEEERLIENFFSEKDADEIPPDLAYDQELFLSMDELRPYPTDMEIPETLIERISAITKESDEKKSGKTHRKWKKAIAYATIGICACMVLTFGIEWGSTVIPTEHPTSLQARHSKPNDVSEQSVEKQKPMAEETNIRRIINESITDKDVMNDGYVEITDPKEAERIVAEIGRLLTTNSQKTNEAIQQVGKTVDEYKQLTKSILQ